MKNTIIFVMVMMMLVPLASAEIVVDKYTNEFSLSSSKISGKACAGSAFELPVKVENVGDEDAVFEVSIQARQDWFSPEHESFHLKAGEEKQTSVSGDIPFGWTGETEYSVIVDSTYGREKRLHRTLEVVKCQNIIIEEGQTTRVIDPAEVATFTFTVKNPATFTDTYKIRVMDKEKYFRLSEDEFKLNPDGEMKIFAYARLPDGEWGEWKIPVKVSTVNNEIEKELELDLRINRAYEFSLEAESSVEACTGLEQTVPVTITNRAGLRNTYDLQINGPRFAKMSSESVTLGPNESTTLDVAMEPASAGSYDIEVSATSRLGSMKTDEKINVNVKNCYGHDVTAPVETVMVCGEETIQANVRNRGTEESKLAVNLDAPAWMELGKDALVLSRAENENVPITIAPPCADGTYDFTLTAKNREFTQFTDSASGTVEVYTPRSAYMLELRQKNFDVKYAQDQVKVIVDNTGIRKGTYSVGLDSRFLTLGDDEVTVDAGGSGEITLNVGDTSGLEYGEYLHTLNFTRGNITYTADIGTNLEGPGIFRSAGMWLMDTFVYSQWYNKLGLCGWSTVILLLALIGLLMVGYAVKTDRIDTRRFKVKYRTHFRVLESAFVVVAILAVIFFVASFSTYKPVFYEQGTYNESPMFIQVKEGHTTALDLDRYFTDPDEDVLTYDYNGTQNVEVDIEGGTALISSDGWSGKETVTFTATDEAGAMETSPKMTIEVLNRDDDITWFEAWMGNCTEFSALVIALIFLVLLFLAEQVAPRGRDYYFGGKK